MPYPPRVAVTQEQWNRAVRRGVAGYVLGQGFRMILPGGTVIEPQIGHPVIERGERVGAENQRLCARDDCGAIASGGSPFCRHHLNPPAPPAAHRSGGAATAPANRQETRP